MATAKSTIRSNIKSMIGRSFTGIDTVLDQYIEMANELFTNNIRSVKSEAEYQYTVAQSDVDNNISSYDVPTNMDKLMDAVYIDQSGSEDVFYDIEIVSPLDLYNAHKFGTRDHGGITATEGARFDYNTQTQFFIPSHRLGSGSSRATRVDRQGRPEIVTRIEDKLHVHPRPGDAEVGDLIRVLVNILPTALSSDSDSNFITDNINKSLEAYAAGLFTIFYFKDRETGMMWIQQGINMLSSYSTKDERNRLFNIALSFSRQ